MPRGNNVKVKCVGCKPLTNHVILNEICDSGETDDGIGWKLEYQIIQCRGCDAISFREVAWSDDYFDARTGDPEGVETLYPSRTAGRGPIQGNETFPARTRRVYSEVLTALNNGAPLLAAIGLRAIIESICKENGTNAANLAGDIDKLAELGLLSKKQADVLHAHRFMGNHAAHEILAPKPQELIAALDIAETLLKTIYILPDVAASITTGQPSSAKVKSGTLSDAT